MKLGRRVLVFFCIVCYCIGYSYHCTNYHVSVLLKVLLNTADQVRVNW